VLETGRDLGSRIADRGTLDEFFNREIESFLTGVAERGVADIMGETDGLDQVFIQP
jgi:hypothetical protein